MAQDYHHGVRVVEVNVCVQSVTFENDKDEKKKPEEAKPHFFGLI